MKKTFQILIPALFFVVLVSTALAQAGGPTPPGGGGPTGSGGGGPTGPVSVPIVLKNPFAVGDNLYDLVKAIVNKVVLPIGGVVCVLAFIYAGFMYVMAQGKPTKIADANRALLYAAIGTAVLLGSWVIATLIETTVNQLLT